MAAIGLGTLGLVVSFGLVWWQIMVQQAKKRASDQLLKDLKRWKE